ncbi:MULTISPECIES: adenosylcobinamide-GDP ribazoletransferase [unclassified Rhizobium]|jgi:adenosylcobinamide-GDP ribazoletransferase|uniref:adenosylcobinamide-GDP ribazoletransferase n=1 Tax=unclassified Rhizobium TaxID=2613769 RepID=UPI00035DC353|nr:MULTISPECIES: adenosylcobinamide-GDP ribazoletransferase [unclassified Rhizobium]MBD9445271.1 adenosylcobinamide-GDP ribazoletransferase [Rhizobium sp. RHZ01]
MNIGNYAADLARAVAFLSRIPMPSFAFADFNGKLDRASRAFPAAGIVIALLPALVLLVMLGLRADRLMSAFAALAVQAALTGALHEDGLADCADGLGGGRDRDHALSIMKDSRIGTYGAISLILSFALRAAGLAAVAREAPPMAAALAIPAIACISRAALVWHWHRLPAAKPDGVAAAAGQPGEGAMHMALATACLFAALLLWPSLGLLPLVCALLACGLSAMVFTRIVRRKLTGHTGDTLGATQQISEIAAFCALAMAF